MISFESLNTPHDIFSFFNEEIEDDGKGSDVLKTAQQVSAGVKTGPQNIALSPGRVHQPSSSSRALSAD